MAHSNSSNRRSHRCDRRGAILVLALVCVAITMAIMSLLVRYAFLHRAAQQIQQHAAQANWLVESALDRAAARLAADPAYAGETWKISAAELQSTEAAAVEKAALVSIAVEPVAEQPNERTIKVVAEYPDGDSKQRARRSKQLNVTLIPQKPVEPEPAEPQPDQPKTDDAKPATNSPEPDTTLKPDGAEPATNGEKP